MSSPRSLFRGVAIAEAVTWGLLLTGMFLKYVTHTTELGVRVFGMVHGVVFIAFCLSAVLVAVDQRWSRGRTLLALLSSVPPFATLAFEAYVERRNATGPAWRLTTEEPRGRVESTTAWLLRNPVQGAVAGLVAVAALTGLALLVGPLAG
ncbi:MAG: rane protein [Nocardioides sp.]|nr:rane protein [Nocardioides sp.]